MKSKINKSMVDGLDLTFAYRPFKYQRDQLIISKEALRDLVATEEKNKYRIVTSEYKNPAELKLLGCIAVKFYRYLYGGRNAGTYLFVNLSLITLTNLFIEEGRRFREVFNSNLREKVEVKNDHGLGSCIDPPRKNIPVVFSAQYQELQMKVLIEIRKYFKKFFHKLINSNLRNEKIKYNDIEVEFSNIEVNQDTFIPREKFLKRTVISFFRNMRYSYKHRHTKHFNDPKGILLKSDASHSRVFKAYTCARNSKVYSMRGEFILKGKEISRVFKGRKIPFKIEKLSKGILKYREQFEPEIRKGVSKIFTITPLSRDKIRRILRKLQGGVSDQKFDSMCSDIANNGNLIIRTYDGYISQAVMRRGVKMGVFLKLIGNRAPYTVTHKYWNLFDEYKKKKKRRD